FSMGSFGSGVGVACAAGCCRTGAGVARAGCCARSKKLGATSAQSSAATAVRRSMADGSPSFQFRSVCLFGRVNGIIQQSSAECFNSPRKRAAEYSPRREPWGQQPEKIKAPERGDRELAFLSPLPGASQFFRVVPTAHAVGYILSPLSAAWLNARRANPCA